MWIVRRELRIHLSHDENRFKLAVVSRRDGMKIPQFHLRVVFLIAGSESYVFAMRRWQCIFTRSKGWHGCVGPSKREKQLQQIYRSTELRVYG